MMNTSNQTYKELAIPFFKETFDCIDEVMHALNIPYYLIGVSAIALELLKEGIKPTRGTKDIDFAVMISNITEYENLSDALAARNFHKVSAPWTFYSEQYKVVIDLLPFGEIEEKYTVKLSERHTDLHVLGFREVMGSHEGVWYGWFIGWIEKGNNTYFFATNIESDDSENLMTGGRKAITLAMLQDLEFIKK